MLGIFLNKLCFSVCVLCRILKSSCNLLNCKGDSLFMVDSQTYLNTYNMRYESTSLYHSVEVIKCKKRHVSY